MTTDTQRAVHHRTGSSRVPGANSLEYGLVGFLVIVAVALAWAVADGGIHQVIDARPGNVPVAASSTAQS